MIVQLPSGAAYYESEPTANILGGNKSMADDVTRELHLHREFSPECPGISNVNIFSVTTALPSPSPHTHQPSDLKNSSKFTLDLDGSNSRKTPKIQTERHPGVFDHVTSSLLPDGGYCQSETQINDVLLFLFFFLSLFVVL